MKKPVRCYNWFEGEPNEQTNGKPISSAEVNLLNGCKTGNTPQHLRGSR